MLLPTNRSDPLIFAWIIFLCCTSVILVRTDTAWGQRSERSALRQGGKSARFRLAQGLREFEKKRYWKAVKHFSAAIRGKPDYAVAYRLRGTSYHRLGLEGPAVKDFTRYIELNSSDIRGYLLRGDSRLFANDLEGAAQDFSRVIELSPRSVEAYLGRGLAFTGLQRYNEAVMDYRRAAVLNPRSADALGNLGRAYMLADKPALAIDYLERAERITTDASWKKQIGKWIEQVRKSLGIASRPQLDDSRKSSRRTLHRRLW
jgi:tetratricopeptide (TPR) repeat protein